MSRHCSQQHDCLLLGLGEGWVELGRSSGLEGDWQRERGEEFWGWDGAEQGVRGGEGYSQWLEGEEEC